MNDSYCELSGYTKEELLGMSVYEIDVDEDAVEVENKIRSVFLNGKMRFTQTHRRKDDSPVKVEITTSFLPYDNSLLSVFVREL